MINTLTKIFDRTFTCLGRTNQGVTNLSDNPLSGLPGHFYGSLISFNYDLSVLVNDQNTCSYGVEYCL